MLIAQLSAQIAAKQTDQLTGNAEIQFRISASPDERAALAPYLGVDAVERLTLAGFIAPHGADGWRVRGRMVAKIIQTCGVTLEPIHARIEEDIERLYLPASLIPELQEALLQPDDDDAPDPFTDSIDPAGLAIESLMLLIDPYPRKEGATLDPEALAAAVEPQARAETAKPFADLAVLMRKPDANDD
jgi:hypothetical protein